MSCLSKINSAILDEAITDHYFYTGDPHNPKIVFLGENHTHDLADKIMNTVIHNISQKNYPNKVIVLSEGWPRLVRIPTPFKQFEEYGWDNINAVDKLIELYALSQKAGFFLQILLHLEINRAHQERDSSIFETIEVIQKQDKDAVIVVVAGSMHVQKWAFPYWVTDPNRLPSALFLIPKVEKTTCSPEEYTQQVTLFEKGERRLEKLGFSKPIIQRIMDPNAHFPDKPYTHPNFDKLQGAAYLRSIGYSDEEALELKDKIEFIVVNQKITMKSKSPLVTITSDGKILLKSSL